MIDKLMDKKWISIAYTYSFTLLLLFMDEVLSKMYSVSYSKYYGKVSDCVFKPER